MQERRRRVAALVVAAGEGQRMGDLQQKAFLSLKGDPILAHAMQPFEACSRVQTLHLVLREKDLRSWHQEILGTFPFRKANPPVPGGPTRQDSVRLGLESIGDDTDVVLIHDGDRPFADTAMLERLLDTMEKAQAAVVGLPAKETMKIVSSHGHVLQTPARETLWCIQTPQAFDYRIIVDAHRKALAEGVVATDDSALVERLGIPVAVVQGSHRNIKITTPEDLVIARAFLENPEWS